MEDASADGLPDLKSVACKATNIPMKFFAKQESGNINDGEIPTDEVLKHLNPGEREEKCGEFDIRESLQCGDESDESDVVEHDVSVSIIFFLFKNYLYSCQLQILSFHVLSDLCLFFFVSLKFCYFVLMMYLLVFNSHDLLLRVC